MLTTFSGEGLGCLGCESTGGLTLVFELRLREIKFSQIDGVGSMFPFLVRIDKADIQVLL